MAEKRTAARNDGVKRSASGRPAGAGGKNTKKAGQAGRASRSGRAGNEPAAPQTDGISIWEEIVLWLILALSVLILISNFGFGGFVGNGISRFCMGMFGFLSYLLPFALFLTAAFLMSNKKSKIAWIKTTGFLLLWIAFCVFCELLNGFDESRRLLDYFKESVENHAGGGLIGGLFCKLLCPALGVAGSYVIVIVLVIISMILITERSVLSGVKKSSERVYESAREDARFRREQAKLRREANTLRREQELLENREQLAREREAFEQQKQRRMDHKISGVTFQTVGGVLPHEKSGIQKEFITAEPLLDFTVDGQGDIYEEELPGGYGMEEKMEADRAAAEGESAQTADYNYKEANPAGGAGDSLPETQRRKNPRSSAQEQKEQLASVEKEIEKAEQEEKQEYIFPPLEILGKQRKGRNGESNDSLKRTAQILQKTLHSFHVEAHVTNVSCGPSVTRYELTPEQGVKVSRIVNLADDIKLNLAAEDIRIEAPIPGKAAVGIEVPNKESSRVYLRELLESEEFRSHPSSLAIAVGKDLAGRIIVADIAKMPHLLIAGATGSGKSVCVNTIIMSLVYKSSPEDVKLIMIDPKVVELSVYNGIPHLFIPVVTDPKKAAGALNWAVAEMTDRYQKFAQYGVRDLHSYNQKISELPQTAETESPKKLPQIVIIVDELADLMMVAPGEVEDAVCRLAQLARAAGLHLILATQRPSVNVITGLIKANMPSRIAFKASSGVDSRTILDMNGAERLLGNGDMLFYPQNYQKPARVQGAFVSDGEVEKVVAFLTEKNQPLNYHTEMEQQMSKVAQAASEIHGGEGDVDEYFADAGKFIIEKDKASIGMLQRMFKIGFNRAARIMDQLSEAGVVGPEEGTKPRKVLMSMEQFENYLEQGE